MFELLDDAFNDKIEQPNHTELAHFLFFEKGIGLEQFNEYPIPYIVEMMKVNNFIRTKEKEQLDKKE
jgi:hypothetical protein